MQNVHRYFLYFALLILGFLSYDVWRAIWFVDATTTLGCHSLRHLVGGRLNVLFDKPVRRTAHDCVSCLNRRHMLFAWMSLVWVGFSDIYVRLCSMGIWTDLRLF